MRLIALLVLVVLMGGPGSAQQQRPLQADGIVRLLADLESALLSGNQAEFEALAADSLPESDAAVFRQATARESLTVAAIRERARRPVADGFEILTEVLLGRARRGRIATWQMIVRPRAGEPARFELVGLREQAALDGLVKLRLDTQQYEARDFVLKGPDFTLEMSSGTAFTADSGTGVTAIVLRGKGTVRFTPKQEAEQGQLRIFNDRPSYTSEIDAAFVRLSPAEYDFRVDTASLVAQPTNGDELRRAQALFDEMAPKSYNLDLRDLGTESWSLEPSIGSILIEMSTRRHGWLTYAVSPAEPEDVSFFDRARTRNMSVYASDAKLAERGPFFSEDDDRAYDIEHVTLDLAFDPERLWVSGRGSLRVRIQRPQVNTLTFKLAEPLAISSVAASSFGRLLTLRIRGQNKVIVSLPRVQTQGAVFVLDIAYSGRVPPQTLDREAIAPQGSLAQEPFVEPLMQPEPRFMYSNRVAWYPQGEVTDYATASLRLTVPSEFQIVASGTPINSTVSEETTDAAGVRTPSRRTVEFVADRPFRYAAVVISRFVPVERRRVDVPRVAPAVGVTAAPVGAVTVEVVSTPRMTGRNRATPDRLASVIGFFARTIGEAPYPDFTLAALDDNLPGGHSPAYFAVLHQPLPTTPFQWTSDPVSFEHVYPHFYLAHEVAHQWWGQAIGWKNYHEQWLSEGLTQYFATVYAESDRGRPVLNELIGRMRDSAMSVLDAGPVSLGYRLGHLQSDGRLFRATVYNKSAVVLHMLRRLVGDEAFFAGLRDFYGARRFQKAGTNDLREALARHTDLPLERFFQRWIQGSGVPRVRLHSRIADDARSATVRIDQVGDDVFDLPLSVLVRFEDGTSEPRELKITEKSSEHTLTFERPVRRIEIKDDLALVRIER